MSLRKWKVISVWFQLLDGYCLSPSGSVIIAGSRVGFVQEQDKHVHTWSITPEGFIRYTPTSDLVLEVKGEPESSVCVNKKKKPSTDEN